MSSRDHLRFYVPEDRKTTLEDLYRAVYDQLWPEKTRLTWTVDRSLATPGASVAVTGTRGTTSATHR